MGRLLGDPEVCDDSPSRPRVLVRGLAGLAAGLTAVFALQVFVVIGGVTRLTESGLSITEWRPITGAIPPLTEAQWLREFELYKRIPEYQQINRGMSLDEFKNIFFW